MNRTRLRTFLFVGFVAVSTRALEIAAWVGGPELPYPAPTVVNVENFQNLQQRRLDQSVIYSVFDDTWSYTKTYADIAVEHGAIPVVTWMANGYPTSDVVAGKADAKITAYANGIKSWGKTIWLRPFHEFNGAWYDWGVTNASGKNSNASVIAAWKHVVQIFRDQGVTNVKWVWCPNISNDVPFVDAYPGDGWVDYVALDGYNWGTSRSWSRWQSFESVFSSSYAQMTALTTKPIFIAEFGSSEKGGDKAAWIRDAFASLGPKFPKVFAVTWFNAFLASDTADWRLTTSQAAVDAWKESIARYAKTRDLLLWDFDDTVSSSAKSGNVPASYSFANGASTATVSSTLAVGGGAVYGAVSPVCSYSLAAEPGAKYLAYAGCGISSEAANLTGATSIDLSAAVKNAGIYRINVISDRYSKANTDAGALLGWDVAIGSATGGQFLRLPVSGLGVPSWAVGRTEIVSALPSVADALLGVKGFTIQPNLSWTDSVTLSTPKTGWIQLDHVLIEGVESFVPSSLTPTPTGTVRAVRDAGLLRRVGLGTFHNVGEKDVLVVSISGRRAVRIPAKGTVELSRGIWSVGQREGAWQTVAVP